MKNSILLKILTPEKTIYQDSVNKIVIPTESGEIGILPNHSPLVSIIKPGEIRIEKDSQTEAIPLSISGGIVEIRPSSIQNNINSEVIILAGMSEFANEIDIAKAEEAYNRAQKAMEEADNLSDIDFAKLQSTINKELNRINIAKKYRK